MTLQFLYASGFQNMVPGTSCLNIIWEVVSNANSGGGAQQPLSHTHHQAHHPQSSQIPRDNPKISLTESTASGGSTKAENSTSCKRAVPRARACQAGGDGAGGGRGERAWGGSYPREREKNKQQKWLTFTDCLRHCALLPAST